MLRSCKWLKPTLHTERTKPEQVARIIKREYVAKAHKEVEMPKQQEPVAKAVIEPKEQQAHLESALVIEKEQQAQLAASESDKVPQRALSPEADLHTTEIVEIDEGTNTVHQGSTLGNEPKAGYIHNEQEPRLKQVVLEDMEKIKHAWEQRDTAIINSGTVIDDVLAQDYQAQIILSQTLIQHDQFWREKARVRHFCQGDRNTSYFHRVAMSDTIWEGEWTIPPLVLEHGPCLVEEILRVTITSSPRDDCFVWTHSKNGSLTAKEAFDHLNLPGMVLPLASIIWQAFIPPSHSFVAWRLMLGKMPTGENLRMRGCVIVSMCPLCSRDCDSSEHLFFLCPFAVAIWSWVNSIFEIDLDHSSLDGLLLGCVPLSDYTSRLLLACIIHSLHTLWMAQNGILFNNASINIYAVITKIRTIINLSASGIQAQVSAMPSCGTVQPLLGGTVAARVLQRLEGLAACLDRERLHGLHSGD
ncbi:hypothetical protein TSUD_371790 [Trifolium subterraneum]|uniref:Reverse transcriptase zinc-binding domain-containing protein n=1 Tax=Trifolium subterraneum TaxID=3900 RepID=A0A2Z6PG76_TRISU|nr:hypothetical protein TSUD_371790 [Trifolium subterraneum]